MLKRLTSLFLTFLFLSGSVLLPLGDFSLMKEIPEMYKNYTKLATPEDMGVLDFIGDYLLGGKDTLGHNKHDKIPADPRSLQFQHTASPLNVVFSLNKTLTLVSTHIKSEYSLLNQRFLSSDFKNEPFRPPLT